MYCVFPCQPGLAKFQAENQPEYIRRKAAEALAAAKGQPVPPPVQSTGEPDTKRSKRCTSVDPLDRPASSSPLPDLPDDLKQKQVSVKIITCKLAIIHSTF